MPAVVVGMTDAVQVAAGKWHALALKADGTVWSWGWNRYGQLGNSTFDDSNTPVQVTGLTGIVSIACGKYHSLAVKSDGTVWAWGYNLNGELGDAGTGRGNHIPRQVLGLPHAVQVSAGDNTSYALMADGTLWSWGDDFYDQLANGTTPGYIMLPAQVLNLTNQTFVGAGALHCLSVQSPIMNTATDMKDLSSVYGKSLTIKASLVDQRGAVLRSEEAHV